LKNSRLIISAVGTLRAIRKGDLASLRKKEHDQYRQAAAQDKVVFKVADSIVKYAGLVLRKLKTDQG
jgi:hypothetical protein